jgi:hypothetical protein
VGVAPEALEECVHSCKVFHAELLIYGTFVSVGFGVISAGLGDLTCVDRRLLIAEDHVWFEDRWMVASLCDE